MKDYTQGAFEALCWTKELCNAEKNTQEVSKRLDEVLEAMEHGFSVDFDAKVKRGY